MNKKTLIQFLKWLLIKKVVEDPKDPATDSNIEVVFEDVVTGNISGTTYPPP